MKLTIERSSLVPVLQHVLSVVAQKEVIPILGNFRLDVEGTELRVSGTNLDQMAAAAAPVIGVDEPGSTTVSARMLHDIAKQMPAGCQIGLETDHNGMTIKTGRSRFKLMTLPAEDFPDYTSTDTPYHFELPASELQVILTRLAHAVAREDTRYYLRGIYMHPVGDLIKAVATDGHRLAAHAINLPDGAADMPGMIIPAEVLSPLAKMLTDGGLVGIEAGDKRIRFASGVKRLESNLVDGTYPDYMRVVPTNNEVKVTLEALHLRDAVARLGLVLTRETNRIELKFAGDKCDLRTRGIGGAEAEEQIGIDMQGADEAEFVCNANYFQQTIEQCVGNTVTLEIAEPMSPILFNVASQPETKYVVLPCR